VGWVKREIPLLEGFRFKADASPLSLPKVYRQEILAAILVFAPYANPQSQGESAITNAIPHVCYSQRRLVFWHTTEWVMRPEAENVAAPSSSGHQRFSRDAMKG
jgi:hypothetical protein